MKLLRFTTIILFSLFIFQCSSDDTTTPDPDPVPITLIDIDGNVYETVTIGGQVWMAENLKTTTYNDGTPITLGVFGDDWYNGNTQLAYYKWADTNDLNNNFDDDLPFDYYGAVYNHFAVETGKLAPEGWRIPTKADFEALETYLSNNGHAGQEGLALKSTTGWSDSSGNGIDVFGFNALPAGYVSTPGTPTGTPIICSWYTSNITNIGGGVERRELVTLFNDPTISFDQTSLALGAGIRLIKE
jgi:uncharacterized protein (TIGR02145 family)